MCVCVCTHECMKFQIVGHENIATWWISMQAALLAPHYLLWPSALILVEFLPTPLNFLNRLRKFSHQSFYHVKV